MKAPLLLMLMVSLAWSGCDSEGGAAPPLEEATAALQRQSCAALPGGPLPVQLVTEAAYQSEELAFDGRGGLVAKKGEELVTVPPLGATRVLSRDPALATLSLGLRFAPDGALIVAQPAVAAGLVARLLRVAPDGSVADFFSAAMMPAGLPPLVIPNGLHLDSRGQAWVSDFATSQLLRVGPGGDVASLVVGPEAASVGGLVLDERRGALFYTSTTGVVRRLPVTADGFPAGAPELVASVPGARLDGVTLDVCGNLYLLDSDLAAGRFRLLRLALDGAGAPSSAPVTLASFDDQVSGVQFGAGPGWDRRSVYVSSIWGTVWRVRVGVEGR